jgi:hypothetical protein
LGDVCQLLPDGLPTPLPLLSRTARAGCRCGADGTPEDGVANSEAPEDSVLDDAVLDKDDVLGGGPVPGDTASSAEAEAAGAGCSEREVGADDVRDAGSDCSWLRARRVLNQLDSISSNIGVRVLAVAAGVMGRSSSVVSS